MECATVSDAQVPANNFLLLFVLLKIIKSLFNLLLPAFSCINVRAYFFFFIIYKMNNFDFQKFFDHLSCSEEIHDKVEHSLLDLIANGFDCSKFSSKLNLILNNQAFVQKDKNDKFFVELSIPKNNDICTNFCYNSCNDKVNVTLNINGVFFPINQYTTIVNVCALYTEFKIRWTFSEEPFSVELMYLSYLLQSDIRKDLMSKSFSFNNINYYDGVAAHVIVKACEEVQVVFREAEVHTMSIEKVPVIAPLDRVDCAPVIEEIMVAAPLDRIE